MNSFYRFLVVLTILLVRPACAITRILTFQIEGQTYYGVLVSQERSLRTPPPVSAETTYEDYSFAALDQLLFQNYSFFEQPENLDLWRRNPDVNLSQLQVVLNSSLRSENFEISEINAQSEKLVKQLIEQWIIEQYKRTRSYIPPEFFDELRKKEPLDKEGATTLALFDSHKRLVATLGLVVRTPSRPRLDLESSVGIQVPPYAPYSTDSYPIMRTDGIAHLPFKVKVAQDAELKKFVVDPKYNRTIIPAMLFYMDITGYLSFGRSLHPDVNGFGPLPAAIGKYYLESDTVGMRIYRSRRYGFETIAFDEKSDTYVMSATREQVVNIWKNFGPRGASFMDIIGPYRSNFQYPIPSYSDGKQKIDSPRRQAAVEHLIMNIKQLSCALDLRK